MLNTPRRRRAFNAVVVAIEAMVNNINFKRFYYGKGAAMSNQLDLTYKDMVLIDGNIKPYSSDPVNKPVALSEVNTYTHALIKTWNQTWKKNYGDWFILPLRYMNSSLPFTTAFDVMCSDGVVRKIYDSKIGWHGVAGTTITMDDVLTFWDTAGISPTAGGHNVPGDPTAWHNKSERGTLHFDRTNNIEILLGKTQDPFFTGGDFFKYNFTAAASLGTTIPATAGIGSVKWLNVNNINKVNGKFGIANRALNSTGVAYAEIQDVFERNLNKWTLCVRVRVNNLNKNRLLSIFNDSNKEICSLILVGVGGSDVGPIWPFYVSGVEKGIKTAGTPRSNVNNWIELMAVKDGDSLTLYINGVLAATMSSAEYQIPANARFVLFGGPGGVGNIANTQIEMLHIWPGYAAPADRAGLVNWMPY